MSWRALTEATCSLDYLNEQSNKENSMNIKMQKLEVFDVLALESSIRGETHFNLFVDAGV